MKVRMYNVGFGDCFCLRDRKKSLLVDFGTNNSRIEGRPRREIFDVIISDLSTINCKNLLLTHFHMDHLSGLLYMMKNRDSSLDFGKIYLPDVFSKEEMSRTLVLLLLADLLKESGLPSRQSAFLHWWMHFWRTDRIWNCFLEVRFLRINIRHYGRIRMSFREKQMRYIMRSAKTKILQRLWKNC